LKTGNYKTNPSAEPGEPGSANLQNEPKLEQKGKLQNEPKLKRSTKVQNEPKVPIEAEKMDRLVPCLASFRGGESGEHFPS
jgi:hypothetical protein